MLIQACSIQFTISKTARQIGSRLSRQCSIPRLAGWGMGSGLVILITAPVALGSPNLQDFSDTTQPDPNQSSLLLAQQVVDRLPPPPPIPELRSPNPGSQSDAPVGNGPTVSEEDAGELFMVYVNGDSPLLLEQVQQVEPSATIQPYNNQTVILVGMFDRPSAANEQIEQLDERGIQANIASVSRVVLAPNNSPDPSDTASLSPARSEPLPAADTLAVLPPADTSSSFPSSSTVTLPQDTLTINANPPELPSTSTVVVLPPAAPVGDPAPTLIPEPVPPSVPLAQASEPSDGAYYVVIPGRTSTLMELREQVVLLGALPTAVVQRDRPLGPHLLVGPFVNQPAASRWNGFFRDFGMDARVYYKR